MNPSICDYYHETNARKRGIQMLVGIHVFSIICWSLSYWMPPFLEQLGPGGRFGGSVATAFRWALFAIGLIGYVIFGLYSIHLIRKGGRWLLCICDGQLIVESPSAAVGATFTTRIENIDAIIQEEDVVADDSFMTETEYHVLLNSGEEHWISSNSQADLPALLKKLREQNPAIREVERDAKRTERTG